MYRESKRQGHLLLKIVYKVGMASPPIDLKDISHKQFKLYQTWSEWVPLPPSYMLGKWVKSDINHAHIPCKGCVKKSLKCVNSLKKQDRNIKSHSNYDTEGMHRDLCKILFKGVAPLTYQWTSISQEMFHRFEPNLVYNIIFASLCQFTKISESNNNHANFSYNIILTFIWFFHFEVYKSNTY